MCHKYLDLNWMGDKSKLHVGFPGSSLGRNAKALIDRGFQICVVEQTDPTNEIITEEEILS